MITLAEHTVLFRLIREYGESCRDVALHPAREAKAGWERAGRRYDAAQKALSAFVLALTDAPKGRKG